MNPTGAPPGAWQGIEIAGRSRKLAIAVLRKISALRARDEAKSPSSSSAGGAIGTVGRASASTARSRVDSGADARSMVKEVDIVRRALSPARLEPREHPRVVLRGARGQTSAMNGEGLELDDGAVASDLRQFGEFGGPAPA